MQEGDVLPHRIGELRVRAFELQRHHSDVPQHRVGISDPVGDERRLECVLGTRVETGFAVTAREKHQQLGELLAVDDVAETRSAGEAPDARHEDGPRAGDGAARIDRRIRSTHQRMGEHTRGDRLADRRRQRGIQLLKQIGEAAAQVSSAGVDDRRDGLRNDRHRHAQCEEDDDEADEHVDRFQHGPLPVPTPGWASPLRTSSLQGVRV